MEGTRLSLGDSIGLPGDKRMCRNYLDYVEGPGSKISMHKGPVVRESTSEEEKARMARAQAVKGKEWGSGGRQGIAP